VTGMNLAYGYWRKEVIHNSIHRRRWSFLLDEVGGPSQDEYRYRVWNQGPVSRIYSAILPSIRGSLYKQYITYHNHISIFFVSLAFDRGRLCQRGKACLQILTGRQAKPEWVAQTGGMRATCQEVSDSGIGTSLKKERVFATRTGRIEQYIQPTFNHLIL
jgi:hypothetical protein